MKTKNGDFLFGIERKEYGSTREYFGIERKEKKFVHLQP